MARAERRGEVVWEGTLLQGRGRIVSVGSGALGELPITWASRTERSDGQTSPEELLAAAHAACYAMAFSHTPAQSGTPAERLTVSAIRAFEQVGAGFKVTTMDLDIRGKVPRLDQAGFEKVAQQAEQGCRFPMPCAIMSRFAYKLTWKAKCLHRERDQCHSH